jgi:arylsulfatase A-like enzyme
MSGSDAVDENFNVVWITMEDTSPGWLGAYGDDLANTPNIDRFAAESRRYDNAVCSGPICTPSRTAAVTGCNQAAIGCHHHRTTFEAAPADGLPTPYRPVVPHYVTGVSERLRRAGYYCTNNGKTDYQFGTPFTMWDENHDEAGWWNRPRDDQPFFAVFNNEVTHESGMWPEGGVSGSAEGNPETDPGAVTVPPYLPDTDKTRRALARHYDNLSRSDEWVGGLLDRLAADGLADETVVVLWSDHGMGIPRGKGWLYDSGLQIPLVVRWPGVTDPESHTDRLVSVVDLPATTLSAAGLDRPPWMHGRPFVGPDAAEREYAFAARDRFDEAYDTMRAVRTQRFKYIRNYEPGTRNRRPMAYRHRHPIAEELLRREAEDSLEPAEQWWVGHKPAEELYDLAADPHETENLAGDPAHAETLDRLREALDDWQRRVGDEGLTDEREMAARMAPEGTQPTTATPTFVPNVPGNRERAPMPDGGTLAGPAMLSLYCATQGASIGYRTGESGRWQLYTDPIRLSAGETTVETKAVRYGHEESAVRTATFVVE